MPKVADGYLDNKRNFIIDCTETILNEKPLSLITMRDIIKKAGFSQGTIYHYYENLDEIYIDLINKNTTDNLLEEKIDTFLASRQPEEFILSECIIAMGEYIEELLKSIGGKTFFEFLVYCSYDLEKKAEVFPRLKFKKSIEYAQNRIIEYVEHNISKGIFRPQIPLASIVMFTSIFIDGVAQGAATYTSGSKRHDSISVVDIPDMFRALSKAIIGFLS